MAKALKIVGTVVAVAALTVATAGVGTALAAGATLSAALATAGSFTVLGVSATALGTIGAGLSFVGSLVSGQPKAGTTASGGTQVDWQADPTAAVPYLIGRTGTAGNIVLADTSGDKNRYLTYVTVFSAGPVKSITGFTADNTAVAFSADGNEGASGHYQNRMWWKASLGAQPAERLAWTATNSKDTPANHSGTPASYGPSFKLSGLAHTLWTLSYDTAIYPGGTPKPMQVVEGVSVYDPRQDSTYAGGSGPCRAGVESTYVYSKNPYLHALTWCIGRFENGFPTLGVHAPVSMIDVAAFVDGANVADSHGWELGGTVYSTDAKWDVLRAMLVAGSGKPGKIGAKITCVVNAPRVSLMTVTGADVCGEAQIPNTQPRRERINTIWPRYREEAQGWQIVPTAAAVTVPAYYASDGGRRTKEVEYTLCQSANQAATLARYDIENAREFGPITLPCKPHLLGLKPGDCLTVNEPEYGMNGQKCLIIGRRIDPADLSVTLTLQSETDGKHPFALGETGEPPPEPGLTGVDIFNVPAPAAVDWMALGGTIPGSGDTARVPAIVVHGTPTDPNVDRLLVDWRLPGSAVWSTARLLKIGRDVPLTTTLEGLPEATGFVVGLRYISVRGIDSARLELGTDQDPIYTGDLDIETEEQLIDGVHLAAATGGNALIDTDFRFINRFWCQNYDETYSCGPTVRVLLAGKGAAQRTTAGTPAANKEFAIGQGYGGRLISSTEQEVRSYGLPCKPGMKIEASAYVTCANLNRVNCEVYFWDASGSSIQPPVEVTPFITDFSGLGSGGDLASLLRPGGFVTAPARAAYATLDIIAFTNGAGPASLTVVSPMLRIAQAGATELAAAVPGVGVPEADQTSTNTSANVAGQGPLATTPTTVVQVLNANIPLGSNEVVDSSMIRGGFAYGPGYSNTTVTPARAFTAGAYGNFAQASLPGGAGAPNVEQGFDIFQTNAGQDQGLGYLLRYGAPVNPGDPLYVSVHGMYGDGATGIRVYALFWDLFGVAIQPAIQVATGGNNVGATTTGYNGDVDNWFSRVGGFITAPANARFATLIARVVVPPGCTGDCRSAAARPFIARVSASQTAPPTYAVGATDRTADQTGTNTSQNLQGQGPLATSPLLPSQVANSNVASGGGNAIVDSEFARGLALWSANPGNSNTPIVAATNFTGGGTNYFSAQDNVGYVESNGTPAAGTYLQATAPSGLPVTPGDRIGGSVNVAFHRGVSASFGVDFYTAGGAYLTGVQLGGTSSAGAYGGANGAGLALISGYTDVPANAAKAFLWIAIVCDGTANPFLFFNRPLLTKMQAGQTAVPGYTPGRTDPTADQTGANTAAAIVGQGALATANKVNLGTQVTNILGASYVYDPATGRYLSNVMPSQAGADVTSANTASRITGQGALAVLSSLQAASQVPLPMAASYAVTFTPQYPLYSSSPGQVTINPITVRLAGAGTFNLPSTSLNTGYGRNVWVFWNFGGHYDYIEGYPTDQLANANGTYLFIGLQVAQAGDGSYPYNNPKPAGGASGLGVLG